MKSPVVKRSIVLSGHKTSVSLEDAFWRGLKDIATTRRMTLSDLVGSIDSEREHGNLSSADTAVCAQSLSGVPSGLEHQQKLSGCQMAPVTARHRIFRQQLGQLGDVGRDAPRLVAGQHVGGRTARRSDMSGIVGEAEVAGFSPGS